MYIRRTGALILFFFICLYIFLKVNGPVPFFVTSIQTTKTNIFQAQGTGKVTGTPNTLLIYFSVNKNAQSITVAQNQVNTTVSKLLDALKRLGIDATDITTTNYSVNPQYDNSQQNITGYSAAQDLQIKIQPLEKSNAAIDILTGNGATNVSSQGLTFDDTTYARLQQQARQKAIKTAENYAQNMASSVGLHLGNIINVEENKDVTSAMPFSLMADSTQTGIKSTKITPGKSDITSNITLSYIVY